MEPPPADPDTAAAQRPRPYSSRPGALIWSFRKSRQRWKQKYRDLKADLKRHRNHVADATKARDQWRARAETADARAADLAAEVAALRARLDALEAEKKSLPPPPR